jgi:hypothetical protein
MTCSETRDLLLQSASPAELPAAASEHARECAACRALAADMARLEQHWRGLPLPPSVESSRAAFVARLADRPKPAPVPVHRFAVPRWAVAAAILVAVAGSSLMFVSNEARASADVIDRLIDWNLDLATATPADRARLGERAAAFHGDLKRVTEADRDLAESLLQNGTWLATNDDPLAVAERFNAVADQLLFRIQAATDAGERKRSDKLSRQYRRVFERGIDPNVRRALASPALNFEHQGRIERVLLSDEGRLEKLAELLERVPDASRKEIRRALELSKKQPKPAKRDRPAGKRANSDAPTLTPPDDDR